ncbi:MAG: type II CAAX endopeptidase family protein [Candidatus Omnitrophota bacterium]
MIKKKISLIAWVCIGFIGLIAFVFLFNHAFPIASIDIRLNRQEVLDIATAFVKGQGYELQGFERTILFDSDYPASVYLQKTQGIKKSNDLIRSGIPIWFWSVRWYKELDKEGFYCDVDPSSGRIINFHHSLLDDAPGAKLDFKQAKSLAEKKLQEQGVNLSGYELKENNTKEQKNRTDYYFVWEKKDYAIDKAHLRLSVSIYGDKLGYLTGYLDIPEEFTRDLQKDISLGQVLSIITTIFMFFLFIAAIVVLVIQFKKDKVNWKFGLFFGVFVSIITVFDFLNSIPLLWSAYPDTMSKGVFMAISAGSMFVGALLIGLIIFLFGSSGQSIADEVLKVKMPVLEAIRTGSPEKGKILETFVVGYSLAFIFLGYISLFYLLGTKYLNIWMPPEAEYSNILGTSMPFLFPLTVAVGAAVSEEFMFRLFAISFFKKYMKLTWLGVLIPALIWAFAHSNYPVFPAYVRGIELTIAGIAFGIVFLKYGLEAVLITHFVIDAALVGLPLIKSQNAYFMISGIVVVGIVFLPVPLVMFISRKQGKLS